MRAAVVAVLVLVASTTAQGHVDDLPDAELASRPVCVVASASERDEDTFSLHVAETLWGDGVVAGDVLPIPRISVRPGRDVAEVGSSSLYFLRRDGGRLVLDDVSCCQPPALKDYYRALREGRLAERMDALLASEMPVTRQRAALACLGGTLPPPLAGWKNVWPRLTAEGRAAPRIRALAALRGAAGRSCDDDEADRAAALALAVLHALHDEEAIVVARASLEAQGDRRALVAAWVLVVRGLCPEPERVALVGRRQPRWALDLIAELIDALAGEGGSKELRSLAGLLDRGALPGDWPNDADEVPAVRARKRLEEVTGHRFPFSVELATTALERAWRASPGERDRVLRDAAPSPEGRLELRLTPQRLFLCNPTRHGVRVVLPAWGVGFGADDGTWFGGRDPADEPKVVVVAPGEELDLGPSDGADRARVQLYDAPVSGGAHDVFIGELVVPLDEGR